MASSKTKHCKYHDAEHPVGEFPKDSKMKDKLSNWCKAGWREYRSKAKKPTGVKTAKPAKKPVVKAAVAKKQKTKEVN